MFNITNLIEEMKEKEILQLEGLELEAALESKITICRGGKVIVSFTPLGFWSKGVIKAEIVGNRKSITWSSGGIEEGSEDYAENFHKCMGYLLEIDPSELNHAELEAYRLRQL